MSSLISAIRDKVVRKNQVVDPPIVLSEQNAASKCKPLKIRTNDLHWALKIESDQHSPLLNCTEGFCRLPDYLIFIETPAEQFTKMNILSCELKSSRTGSDGGVRQVQMGRFLAEYLMRLGRHALGQPAKAKATEDVSYYGAIVCPDPKPPLPMPKTKVGRIEYPSKLDVPSSMLIYDLPDGISVDLRDLCL